MSDSVGDRGEFALIASLTASLKSGEGIPQGIGDDCAVLRVGDKELLLTCDASLEDIHFKRNWGTPEDIGWKAAVSALSDIAAMGGRPVAVLVTLALPEALPVAYAEGVYRGLANAVESTGATIVGGDTTASRSGIVIDLSVIGEVVGRAVLRSDARPGDVVAVTGAVGERGAGLHALLNGHDAPDFIRAYLHPSPRIDEGVWLQEQSGVHAMMDVSDGLLPDVRHIAKASGVGINLLSAQLPNNVSLWSYWAEQGMESMPQRLCSGEEYELLVMLQVEEAPAMVQQFMANFDVEIHPIGVCTDRSGEVWVDGEPPAAQGFEHFRTP